MAFPFTILEKERVVSYAGDEEELVVFFVPGTLSALDQSAIGRSRDVGATGVFDPVLDGQWLSFAVQGESIVDNETGSVWNGLGQATEGPMSGSRLTLIVHASHFWFAWGAFKPNTIIYQSANA